MAVILDMAVNSVDGKTAQKLHRASRHGRASAHTFWKPAGLLHTRSRSLLQINQVLSLLQLLAAKRLRTTSTTGARWPICCHAMQKRRHGTEVRLSEVTQARCSIDRPSASTFVPAWPCPAKCSR